MVAGESFADRSEEIWRGREKECADTLLAALERIAECLEVRIDIRIDLEIVQMTREAGPLLLIELAANVRPAAGLHLRQELIALHVAARDTDDARILGDLAREQASIKGRKQFAQGKVARAAEEDQIESRKLLHAGPLSLELSVSYRRLVAAANRKDDRALRFPQPRV